MAPHKTRQGRRNSPGGGRRAGNDQNKGTNSSAGGGGSGAGVRLQRVMAEAGVAARRACEAMIEEGRVRVNGEKVRRLPVFVDPAEDRIEVDGRPLPRREEARPRQIYLMLNKPPKTLCVASDEPGADRRTVLDLVDHPSKPRLFPVGRLEYDATGLVLLTNDGEMANRLTHPRYGVPKTYEALVKGSPSARDMEELEKTVHRLGKKAARERSGASAGVRAARVELHAVGRQDGKTLLEITLREGRNKEVADALSLAGFEVKRFTQIKLGPLELKGVAQGMWRELTRDEMQSLRALMRGKGGPEKPGRGQNRHVGSKPAPARADEQGMGKRERGVGATDERRVTTGDRGATRSVRSPGGPDAPRESAFKPFKPRTLTPD